MIESTPTIPWWCQAYFCQLDFFLRSITDVWMMYFAEHSFIYSFALVFCSSNSRRQLSRALVVGERAQLLAEFTVSHRRPLSHHTGTPALNAIALTSVMEASQPFDRSFAAGIILSFQKSPWGGGGQPRPYHHPLPQSDQKEERGPTNRLLTPNSDQEDDWRANGGVGSWCLSPLRWENAIVKICSRSCVTSDRIVWMFRRNCRWQFYSLKLEIRHQQIFFALPCSTCVVVNCLAVLFVLLWGSGNFST